LLSGLVLATGLLSTWIYWEQTQRHSSAALEKLFQADSERIHATIARQLDLYQVAMRGVQGFFRGSEQVYYAEFAEYVPSLDLTQELEGVQGVAYAKLVSAAELPRHLAQMAAELPVAYRIHPAGSRQYYAPIGYIDPLDDANLAALGFDILTNPAARTAAERARDTGEIAISPPTALVQDSRGSAHTSFIMYLPVYDIDIAINSVEDRRRALLGWVDVPFRMRDLMAGMAAELDPTIDIDIRDAAVSGAEGLLHQADSISHGQRAAAGELQTERSLNVGGREWQLLFSSTAAYRANRALLGGSSLILWSGIASSVMLALLVFVIAYSRVHNQRRAVRMSHLYRALSEINQAIVRMDRESELFPMVCRLAVEDGGMAMAWVGQIDAASGNVVPVATHGEGVEALQPMPVASLVDRPEGAGPVGTALRENRIVIVNDFLEQAGGVHWHADVQRLGWHAGAAFPLHRNGEPVAVLNVYHRKAGAFDEDTVGLLREMSDDISFALDNFDRATERVAYEQALLESEERLSTILENVGACIYLKDTRGRYTYVNQQVLNLWGVGREAVLGRDDSPFFDARSVARVKANDRRVLRSGEVVQTEETDTLKAGGLSRTFWSVKIPLRNTAGEIYGLCGISTDISEKKADQDRIRYLSNYDALTGLPNRTLLQERASVALASAKATESPVALLYIDLDRFTIINDSLGHGVGDRILVEMARRLSEHLHMNATLCRAGGDEFYLLLPNMAHARVMSSAAELLELIALPMQIDGQRLEVSASIGVACYPEHGGNLEELAQCADAALAQAKNNGRGQVELFAEEMLSWARKTLLVESELREALRRDELLLHYQPQIDMRSGRVTGIEALVRWQHPERGLILPGRFIPVAEESSLIIEIGNWVMETAVAQQAAWQAEGIPLVPMAVNLSVVQVYSSDFCDMVEAILRKHALPTAMLELELTESIAMEHSDRTLATLARLNALGVNLAIDDFGTGYSSLSYLKRYPLDKLKIDKSFVDGLADSAEDQAIVMAIIGIARGLGYKTVAEGVETREQWQFLRENGCDAYQGYYFSKPAPAEVISDILLQTQGEKMTGAG
tara:strand:+ start:13253 stop:16498 length:3246 start_codon:yes stop_codon:yes gene_type:complete